MNSLSDFVWAHRHDDPAALALSGNKYPGIRIAEAARQVAAYRKIQKKVPEWYRPGLQFPPSLSLEQASSAASALFKASLFTGNNMADLSGGMGVDAFYFAEKFQSLVYVEQDAEVFASALHNFQVLGRENITGHRADASEFLHDYPGRFDLIYLDPARRHEQKGKVFQLADCSPNILKIKNLLLNYSDKILIKTAPMLDIHLALRQLEYASRVWVLEYEKECREVLYLLEKNPPPAEVLPVTVAGLQEDGREAYSFTFTYAEESALTASIAMPGPYLYEPFPGILKSGAYKSFGERYGLSKLHGNTHLYTGDNAIEPIPARIFRIIGQADYDRKSLARLVPDGKANIAARNFPDKPEAVKKRLGLRDGGDLYLFATTLADDKKAILICQKA